MKNLQQAASPAGHRSAFTSSLVPWTFLLGLTLLWTCKTPPPPPPVVRTVPAEDSATGERTTSRFSLPEYPYRPSATRAFDLEHTRLEVSFDWEKEQMRGEARLRMSPWFYPRDSVRLDARGMLIHRVALFQGGQLRDLPYTYDNVQLAVALDRAYTRKESLELYVDYTARPNLLDSLMPEGVPTDKGLYFINARGQTPGKPTQIWTQGESHGSPAWFPTFDNPAERCTQEILITVPHRFTTLSNGLLVNSSYGPDSVRTDHWRMTLPHAPYLFAMAIGEYAVVKDEWRGREVSYYVEPQYAPYARLIFGKTPQMMEFFSERLGVEYPWEKYGQVVVQDFVSGAMENTTATIHMGGLQHDAREHLDNTYEDYISHELFHQWFGDLVTCESWANLTLNEGFATYGEVLWREHAYGEDDAMRHHLGDRLAYLYESRRKQVPLIRYHHRKADDMFDAHSYQKGGQVLHMLRKLVGDDAFFESLRIYLSKNAYTDVEIHELRLAFEEVTGQDLNWFFDQWFLAAGHPVLELERTVADGAYQIRVRQVQDGDQYPLFRFPVDLEIVTGDRHRKQTVWVASADTTFTIATPEPADCIIFDADNGLLAQIKEDNNPAEHWVAQLRQGRHYGQKSAAMNALMPLPFTDAVLDAILPCLHDPYHGTRGKAVSVLLTYSGSRGPEVARAVFPLMNDPEASVRKEALDYLSSRVEVLPGLLAEPDKQTLLGMLEERTSDSSYSVQVSALRTLYQYDAARGKAVARTYSEAPPASMVGAVGAILRSENDPGFLDFVIRQYEQQPEVTGRVGALSGLGEYIPVADGPQKTKALELLKKACSTDPAFYPRYFAARTITNGLMDEPGIRDFVSLQAEKETVEILRKMYEKALK